MLRSTGTASAEMSPAASRYARRARSRRATSASSITSGYGGSPGSCWIPDERQAADQSGLRLAHVEVVAQHHREQEPTRGRQRAVKLYGPPVARPKSEVPTALPPMSVNGVGRHRLPVRAGLVVVGAGPARDRAARRSGTACRSRRSPRRDAGGSGSSPNTPRRRPARASCGRGRRRCPCSPCTT